MFWKLHECGVGSFFFLCATLEVFTALQLRIQVFWDVKLFHWVSDVLRCNGLWCVPLRGQAVEEERTCWTAWPLWWRDCDHSETQRTAHIDAVSYCRRLESSPVCAYYMNAPLYMWGTRWRSWLRHCTTSQKVTGSIPSGVIGIFHWHNPSGRTMALGLTQPLTEMSTRNIFWGVKVASV
jgi:hypothetical protein